MYDYLNQSDVGYPKVPEQLETCFNSGSNWNLEDGSIVEDKNARQKVMDALLGTIFTISTHLVQKEIVSAADLELGIKTALAWPQGPFTMMNNMGMEKTKEMIALVCNAGLFNMPEKFKNSTPDQWAL
jgi:3-hydroxyacyl-CoA dehydrogenase